MLKFLRKGAKSFVAKVLIALLVASFAVWGVGDIFSFRLDSRVARVGDTEILAGEFASALDRERSRLTRQLGRAVDADMLRAAGIDRRVLGQMIRDAAFAEELKRLGLDVPDEAVVRAIRTDPAFAQIGGFSDSSYRFVLQQMGRTAPVHERIVRARVARGILENTAIAAVQEPPGAGARLAAWQGETRTVTLLTLGLDLTPDPGTPDETALADFYAANEALFTEPERRSGQYIHVDAARLLQALEPDEATLRQRYDADLARFTSPPSRTIDQISYPDRPAAEAAQARLLSGDATFETLGTEMGLDAAGLALGTVTAAELPEAVAAAVFGLTEPGIVGPVDLPAGSALFRVREVNPGGAAPFEAVRDQLAAEAAREALAYEAPEVANRVEELRAEGLSFAAIAARAGADAGEFSGLARDGSLSGGARAEGVLATEAFLAEAFAALDMEERDLVETPEGGYVLIMVREIAESRLLPLAEVRERAVAAWQQAERRKALAAKGAELASRLGSDSSIWDIGAELGLAARPLAPFSRGAPPADQSPELVEALFGAPLAGGAAVPVGDGSSVVLGQVAAIEPAAPERIESGGAAIGAMLADSLRRDTLEYFSRAVEAGHETGIEPGVITEVFRRLAGGQ